MEKSCSMCLLTKSVSEFPLKRGKPNARCFLCKKAVDRVYRENNKEKIRVKSHLYWESIKGSEKQKTLNSTKCRTFRKKNPELFRYYASEYRAQVLQATPVWADKEGIKQFYKDCPKGYHVDHIIPLRGTVVTGLHVLNNLQYLLPEDNFRKSNKYL